MTLREQLLKSMSSANSMVKKERKHLAYLQKYHTLFGVHILIANAQYNIDYYIRRLHQYESKLALLPN